MANTFGQKLKVTVFGQSHSECIGVVIDNLPAGMLIDMEKVKGFMDRRAPGQNELSTARREEDIPKIISGLNENGVTCGAPLCAVIENRDARSSDYDKLKDVPRPGHSDYAAYVKFNGNNDIRGGGQFSGRMTAPLCFAGAVCIQLLESRNISIASHLLSVGGVRDDELDAASPCLEAVKIKDKAFPTISDEAGQRMADEILKAKNEGDSIGGIIEACVLNLPAGLGDPMFDGIENRISSAVFAIPAVKGIEFGAGFSASLMKGSEHNDEFFVDKNVKILTKTNNHGGILGGITTGMPLVVRAAVKPTPSIALEQKSVSLSGLEGRSLSIIGRHDPCIALRALPCVEAALAIVFADLII